MLLTPHLLILLGAWGLSGRAPAWSRSAGRGGVVAAAMGLLGYPRHVVLYAPRASCLVSVLRERRLPWTQVRGIERTRPGAAR